MRQITLRLIVMIQFLLFFCLLIGCDIFKTRDPESPELPRSNYVPATTPDILIQNFINSFKDKVQENYISCFSEKKFIFAPSAESASKFSFLLNWTLQDERQYFNNLINQVPQNSEISLKFLNEQKNFYGDSSSYSAIYSLSVPFIDAQKPKYYQGSLHFVCTKDQNNQWVISNWQDIKDEKYPSWSELKGRLN
ncbi:MAG: hypothetical protein ACM34K_12055 [Bacillota bacterium]